ncbi:MAG: methyltransferase domain-containing protein [Rhodovibrionaceae bacterium]
MTSREERLAAVYAAEGRDDLERQYKTWAEHYDADVFALGYAVPGMVAAMTARHLPHEASPILDCGAGTGLLGVLLTGLGYRGLTAIDMSREMLALAEARGIYDACRRMVLGARLDFPDDVFAGVVAAGVFTAGHAPAESFDELCRVTRPGGLAIFGARADGAHGAPYRERQDALEAAGAWRLEAESEAYPAFLVAPEEAHVLNRVFVYRVAG